MAKTEGARLGETHSEKYWSDRLARLIADEYDTGIGQCINVDLPDGVRAYARSTAYNAVFRRPVIADDSEVERGRHRRRRRAIEGWRVASHPVKGGPAVVQRGLIHRAGRH